MNLTELEADFNEYKSENFWIKKQKVIELITLNTCLEKRKIK